MVQYVPKFWRTVAAWARHWLSGFPKTAKKKGAITMSAGKNMALIVGALCALLAAARGEVYAANIYVDSSVDADGDGQSWATVGRSRSNPRRCGSASDIGCCELWRPSGFILQVR